MKKRIISLLVVAVMVLGLFAACSGNNGALSADDAKKVVIEDLKLDAAKAPSMDVHMTTVDGLACYAVYITTGGQHWEYVINSITGEILERNQQSSGHNH